MTAIVRRRGEPLAPALAGGNGHSFGVPSSLRDGPQAGRRAAVASPATNGRGVTASELDRIEIAEHRAAERAATRNGDAAAAAVEAAPRPRGRNLVHQGRALAGLRPLEKLALLLLCAHANRSCDAWPSLAYLAAEMGVTTRAAWQAVEGLAARGLITKTRRGYRRSNNYHVNGDAIAAWPRVESRRRR